MQTLQALLLENHQKTQANIVVQWVGNDPKRMAQLVKVVLANDEPMSRRAAWPLSYVVQQHPDLAAKHLRNLVGLLHQPGMHNGITRNVLRLLQFVAIPKPLQGQVMDRCFRLIEDLQEKPAIKAFALTILYNLSKMYPEILPEISSLVEASMPYESPAFRARAKVFLKIGMD